MNDGDIGLYWTTLRVFTEKMATLLENQPPAKEQPSGDIDFGLPSSDPESQARDVVLSSTTNSLAALLKVQVPHDLRVGDNHITFANTLLNLAQEHLAKFDALVARLPNGKGER